MNIKELRQANKEYKLCKEKVLEFIHQGIDYEKEDVECKTTKDYNLFDFWKYIGNQEDLTNPKNQFIPLKYSRMIKKIQLDEQFMLSVYEEDNKTKVNINGMKLFLIDGVLKEEKNVAKVKDIKKMESKLKKQKDGNYSKEDLIKIQNYHASFNEYNEVQVYIKDKNVLENINDLINLK